MWLLFFIPQNEQSKESFYVAALESDSYAKGKQEENKMNKSLIRKLFFRYYKDDGKIPDEVKFYLHDTHGFPSEVIDDWMDEENFDERAVQRRSDMKKFLDEIAAFHSRQKQWLMSLSENERMEVVKREIEDRKKDPISQPKQDKTKRSIF